MTNIGKIFKINTDPYYLDSIGIYDAEIIDSKGVLVKEFDLFSALEVDLKYSFHPDIQKHTIMVDNKNITLI